MKRDYIGEYLDVTQPGWRERIVRGDFRTLEAIEAERWWRENADKPAGSKVHIPLLDALKSR